jgi:hypothetical protein
MNVAIIGAGNVGQALGKRWATAGHHIVFGVRNPAGSKTKAVLQSIPGATAASVPQAARGAEIIVLATPWPATNDAVDAAGNLAGKIVLDCTNPVKADLSGLEIGHTTSAGEQVAQWARGAAVYKTFNQTGSDNMELSGKFSPKPVMFYCGDDATKKSIVKKIVEDAGFEAIDAGPIQAARWLEPLAMLWIHLAIHQKMGPNFAYAIVRR